MATEVPHKQLATNNVVIGDHKSYSHGYLVRDDEHQAYALVMTHSRQSSMSSTDQSDHQCENADSFDGTNKSYDAVLFDPLKVAAEDFASQITLLDLPVFTAIQSEELASCAWSTKDKLLRAPNIVQFTRRFNQVNFWVQTTILNTQTLQRRADILSHFIKIAKQLYYLNNLHSVMAIISALQSAPIYRLSRTWALIARKDRQTYEKIADLFSENDNRASLRKYMDSTKLPCIPYLGLYLTDIVYVDIAHPYSGGMESNPRKIKMNNILRVISELQQSTYEFTVMEHIQSYLHSVRYIEELQKFLEDDNYRLSLQIEPSESTQKCKDDSALSSSPTDTKPEVISAAITPTSKFVPKHRKTRSLGNNISSKQNEADRTQSLPVGASTPQRHLIDDSVLEEASLHSSLCSVTKSFDDNPHSTEKMWDAETASNTDGSDLGLFAGIVKRKAILKKGRRPRVSHWKKFWVQIWGTNILYYPCKSSKATQRSDFKSDPAKMHSILGWMVILSPKEDDEVEHFKLTSGDGSVYKFLVTSPPANVWVEKLQAASTQNSPKVPENLIHFQ
ncbi:ras-specific guanine nucleotide-releasing factor RalGPS1-like [Watersipora subatra]|uniref:ras-specific guanine nucleotide-releasing factor RalGPS1-like n=1 Tax=Watersipora subatra TaxID=2589382 RepID=UPI00355BDC46